MSVRVVPCGWRVSSLPKILRRCSVCRRHHKYLPACFYQVELAYSRPSICLQRLAFIVSIPDEDRGNSWATFNPSCSICLVARNPRYADTNRDNKLKCSRAAAGSRTLTSASEGCRYASHPDACLAFFRMPSK